MVTSVITLNQIWDYLKHHFHTHMSSASWPLYLFLLILATTSFHITYEQHLVQPFSLTLNWPAISGFNVQVRAVLKMKSSSVSKLNKVAKA